MIAERAFHHLDAPVRRLGALDVPVPFSPPLEDETVPTPELVAATPLASSAGEPERGGRLRWAFASYGVMGVDWEERANFDRLRSSGSPARRQVSSGRSSARCSAST